MPKKEQWRDEWEAEKKFYLKYPLCCRCQEYHGEYLGTTHHKGKNIVERWRCAKHNQVINTRYSFACGDYKQTPEPATIQHGEGSNNACYNDKTIFGGIN